MPSKIIEDDLSPRTVFVPAFADHTEDGEVLLTVGHAGIVASPVWARSFAAQIVEEADCAEIIRSRIARRIEAQRGETSLDGSTPKAREPDGKAGAP